MANRPPIADAGPDQYLSCLPGIWDDVGNVFLDPSGSWDPDPGDSLSFQWTQIGGISVELSANWFDDLPGIVGSATFRLTVTDPHGATDTDEVVVTVLEDVDNAIFVSSTLGDDNNDGTMPFPVKTIRWALELADTREPTRGSIDIYVHEGDYNPGQTLVLKNDSSMYGGFEAVLGENGVEGWARLPAVPSDLGPPGPGEPVPHPLITQPLITRTHPTTINGLSIALEVQPLRYVHRSPSTIDGFIIISAPGGDAAGMDGAGENSIGIYLHEFCEQLSITNNEIRAGYGGSGKPGDSALGGDLDGKPGENGDRWDCRAGRGGDSPCGMTGGQGGRGGVPWAMCAIRELACPTSDVRCEGEGEHGCPGAPGDTCPPCRPGPYRLRKGGHFGAEAKGSCPWVEWAGADGRDASQNPIDGGPGVDGYGGAAGLGTIKDATWLAGNGRPGTGGGNGHGGGGGFLEPKCSFPWVIFTVGGGGGASCGIYVAEGSSPTGIWVQRDWEIGPPGDAGYPGGQVGITGAICPPPGFIEPIEFDPIVVEQGSVNPFSWSLPSGRARFNVSLSYGGSDIVLTLTSPSGRIIDRSTTDPNVVHVKGPTSEIYTITNPEEGEWIITLFGADVPPEGETASVIVAEILPNKPPVADAGHDQTVECTGADTSVTLDGSGSSDPDCCDALAFEWMNEDADIVGTSDRVTLTLPLGVHVLILTVDDGKGGTDANTVTVTVQDTTPPVITLDGPATLTLVCGEDTYVELGATATDTCDPNVPVVIGGGETVMTQLVQDYPIGFDVVLSSRGMDPQSFGKLSESGTSEMCDKAEDAGCFTPSVLIDRQPASGCLPIAHWKLDETAGTIAYDSAGGNDGTLVGDPASASGRIDGALALDGIDDYVDVGSVGISGAAPRTIAGWAKATTTNIPAWTNVFGFTNSSQTSFRSFDIQRRGGQDYYCIHAYSWEMNIVELDLDWHHLAATYDGTTVTWYGEGLFVGSDDVTLDTIDNVQMGKRADNENYFPGLIDDVRIYDCALSADEIRAVSGAAGPGEPQACCFADASCQDLNAEECLAQGGTPQGEGTTCATTACPGPAVPDLVAHYKLDEGSGTIAVDASGYGHHGTAQNAVPTWVDGQPAYGKAMHFDGTPACAWVDCGTWNPSEATGQLTVALWVKWDGPNGSYQGLIAKSDGWDDQGAEMMWMLEISQDNHDVYFHRAGSWVWCGGIVLPEGQWSHVAATFDGSTMIFYVDGDETGRGDWSFGAKTDATIVFGAAYQPGWNRFNGALDDIRIYSLALSQAEIKELAE